MTVKSQFNKLAILALVILVSAQGCIWGSVQYDQTLGKEVIDRIKPGETTRRNIQQWLGPPKALARKDGKTLLPFLIKKQGDTSEGAAREVDSKYLFEPFSANHSISEDHVVYFYFDEREQLKGFSIPLPLGGIPISLPATFGTLQFSKLWILVNHKTGNVEDYVFKEGEEE